MRHSRVVRTEDSGTLSAVFEAAGLSRGNGRSRRARTASRSPQITACRSTLQQTDGRDFSKHSANGFAEPACDVRSFSSRYFAHTRCSAATSTTACRLARRAASMEFLSPDRLSATNGCPRVKKMLSGSRHASVAVVAGRGRRRKPSRRQLEWKRIVQEGTHDVCSTRNVRAGGPGEQVLESGSRNHAARGSMRCIFNGCRRWCITPTSAVRSIEGSGTRPG